MTDLLVGTLGVSCPLVWMLLLMLWPDRHIRFFIPFLVLTYLCPGLTWEFNAATVSELVLFAFVDTLDHDS